MPKPLEPNSSFNEFIQQFEDAPVEDDFWGSTTDWPEYMGSNPLANERVSFGIDDEEYGINLSAEHAAELRAALASYITAARVVRDDHLDLPMPPHIWPIVR